MNSLVSIIIPTYNRVHLIGETLDSVIAQTYTNWECIVVDDGSNDYTDELLEFYCENDSRIKYYHRPKERAKGANVCRNYGFDMSKGEYVNWFDADDLMTPENLALRLQYFDRDTDFIIGDTINFNDDGLKERAPRDYSLPINPGNFISFRIAWITNEITLKKEAVKIRFNENLESDQDYNFFSRLLYLTNKGKYLKKSVILRRMHKGSIQGKLKEDQTQYNEQLLKNEYHLLVDIQKYADKKTISRILQRLIRVSYNLTGKFTLERNQFLILKCLYKNHEFRALLYYTFWISVNLFSGHGYFLIRKANKSLNDFNN